MLWDPKTEFSYTTLEMLIEESLKYTHTFNLMITPLLLTYALRKNTQNEVEFLFTAHVGLIVWGIKKYEPLIFAFFLHILSHRKWKGNWIILKGNRIKGITVTLMLRSREIFIGRSHMK